MARDCVVSHNIDADDLRDGDHIYCHRVGYTFSHHGIYDEERREVIHLTGDSWASSCSNEGKAGVEATSLKEFLKGNRLRLYTYSANTLENLLKLNGSCSTKVAISGKETVEIARWFVRHPTEFGNYSLSRWNCESFAKMCKTARDVTAEDLDRENASGNNIRQYMKNKSSTESDQGSRFGTPVVVVKTGLLIIPKSFLSLFVGILGLFAPKRKLALK